MPEYPTDNEKQLFNSGQGGGWMSTPSDTRSRAHLWWVKYVVIALFIGFALCVAYV